PPAGNRDGAGAARRARGAPGGGGLARGGARRAQGDRARERPADGEGGTLRAGGVRAAAQGEPALRTPVARGRRGGRGDLRGGDVTAVETPRKRKPARGGPGSGHGEAWRVVVLNDDHNTFEGVAFALASVIPGVSYERGLQLANRIH